MNILTKCKVIVKEEKNHGTVPLSLTRPNRGCINPWVVSQYQLYPLRRCIYWPYFKSWVYHWSRLLMTLQSYPQWNPFVSTGPFLHTLNWRLYTLTSGHITWSTLHKTLRMLCKINQSPGLGKYRIFLHFKNKLKKIEIFFTIYPDYRQTNGTKIIKDIFMASTNFPISTPHTPHFHLIIWSIILSIKTTKKKNFQLTTLHN